MMVNHLFPAYNYDVNADGEMMRVFEFLLLKKQATSRLSPTQCSGISLLKNLGKNITLSQR